MTRATDRFGRAGEDLARRYLEERGYSFVAANWRCRWGELDLVMRDGETLVIVEVKSRHGERAGRAEEGISQAQGRRILTTAEFFVHEHPTLAVTTWRVDLVAVTYGRDPHASPVRITHWPDAIVTG